MINEVIAKTALYKLKTKRFPYEYDLNIYKGCSHGCKYCYARCSYSKFFNTDNNFQEDIYVKTNIAEILDIELSKKDYTDKFINLGSVCDSYQPIELKYEIMKGVWNTLIKHKQPTIISTKSALIMRDIELINELSQLTKVIIGVCITTADPTISKKVEPGASLPIERYLAMKELKLKTNAVIGLHTFPMLPYLTDLETIFKWGKEAEVDYVLPALLHIRGDIRKSYMPFIHASYPNLYEKYLKIYEKDYVSSKYKTQAYNKINLLLNKYSLSTKYPHFTLKSSKSNLPLF